MPRTLSSDDVGALGAEGMQSPDPRSAAATLVAAVDEERIEDPSDVAYALVVAADLHERAGDLDGALALATRALDHPDSVDARAARGRLLVLLDRVDEGMGELRAMRPLLTRDVSAAFSLPQALEELGQGELAEEWLTAALLTVAERAERRAEESGPSSEAALDAEGLAATLGQARYRVRRNLDLPVDEHDESVDLFRAGLDTDDPFDGPFDDDLLADDALEEDLEDDLDEGDDEVLALFWPQPEFDELVRRWPHLRRTYGATWDDHRASTEFLLRTMADEGEPAALVVGTVADLVAVSGMTGLPADSRDLHEEYVGTDDLPWPPGRNDPCWCGSGGKYKKCCLPRGREAAAGAPG